MARIRKPHPADVANANIVAAAVRFEIALFLGTGRYATDSAKTLEEAPGKAARLVALHPNGRRPLIYGVAADGRSGLVTDTVFIKEDPMKTYAKKFNAQRAAKAAGHSPDEVEILRRRTAIRTASKAPRPPTKRPTRRRLRARYARGRKMRKADEKQKAVVTRPLGKRAAIEAAAREGKLPAPPDFRAETHKRFRNKLASVVELAKAGDLKGLRAFEINPISSKRSRVIAIYASLRSRRVPENSCLWRPCSRIMVREHVCWHTPRNNVRGRSPANVEEGLGIGPNRTCVTYFERWISRMSNTGQSGAVLPEHRATVLASRRSSFFKSPSFARMSSR
jgi:hypothetical protein